MNVSLLVDGIMILSEEIIIIKKMRNFVILIGVVLRLRLLIKGKKIFNLDGLI